jgi:hypothetical protein
MTRALCTAAFVCAIALSIPAANAKPRHQMPRQDSAALSYCAGDQSYRSACPGQETRTTVRARVRTAYASQDGVVGRRPAGCPARFCGCEASLFLFGRIIPDLNLAANWVRKFPKTSPAPRMAAARSGHVFVLISHVEGSDWLVHDGNSGGGQTREHVRSIRGYQIVDPNGHRVASG